MREYSVYCRSRRPEQSP